MAIFRFKNFKEKTLVEIKIPAMAEAAERAEQNKEIVDVYKLRKWWNSSQRL